MKVTVILFILLFIFFFFHQKESFTQNNFFNTNEPYNKLFTNCKKNIFGDARNNTFCYDKQNIDYIENIYKNNKFKNLYHYSYYYPPYLSTYFPSRIIMSDWYHNK
jgi:hypothetical protein